MLDIPRMQASQSTPGEIGGRIVVRLGVLATFAAASSQPFWTVLTNLLLVGAGLATVMAAGRRERPLGPALTHFDEAAFYALLGCGLAIASVSAAVAG